MTKPYEAKMINKSKINKIYLVTGLAILGILSWHLVKNNITPTTIGSNLETKIKKFMSIKLDYIEVEKDGTTYVNYKDGWYKVIPTKFVKDRGLDHLVELEGIQYNEEQRYFNAEYNKEHREGGVPQPGDIAYVLEPIDNPNF